MARRILGIKSSWKSKVPLDSTSLSSYSYQTHRKFKAARVPVESGWICMVSPSLGPDLTILLDVDVLVGLKSLDVILRVLDAADDNTLARMTAGK